MIVRAKIQPFADEIDVTGALKTTAKESSVMDLGEPLQYKGNEIQGTDKPLLRMGMKVYVMASTPLTESSAGTNYLILKILTGDNGTTATKEIRVDNLYAEDINEGKEIILPDERIGRSLKFSISANADNPFTAGKVRILLE